MSYTRKTKDIYCIESNCGYGWEIETTYNTYAEAKENIDEYRKYIRNYFGVCRITKRREKIA